MKQFTHFSHRHPLHLTNPQIQNPQNQNTICSCCEINLTSTSQSYTCTKPNCNFSLHIPCFNLPSQFTHKSHPKHPLSLLNDAVPFPCNACGDYSPNAFAFCCDKCEFVLHVDCASLPEVEKREDHEHPLSLFFSVPLEFEELGFDCGVCREKLEKDCWGYWCLECNYGTHLECV